MPSSTRPPAKSEQIFRSADSTTQAIIREVLNVERTVMHMRRREDIHSNVVQIIKRNIPKA